MGIPAMKVLLTVISGPHQGRTFEFEEHNSFIAGRSRKAQFRLPDKDQFFSRVHFLIELNPPLCRIVDLQSRNGTFVNNRRITSAELVDGDRIEAGDTLIQVSLPDSSDESPTQLRFADRMDHPTILKPVSTVPPPGLELLPKDYLARIARRAQPVSGYLIVDELGRGGMGIVYLAIREATQSVVALKTIRPAVEVTEVAFERFRREAMILRDLDHPHIVPFRDVGEFGGHIYFAMDYVPGVDGQTLIKEQAGPFPVGRAVGIVCQLLSALEHAHGLGYVHRDVKPSNLLVQQVGGRDSVWLTDFGLARTYQSSRLSGLTMTGDFGGTMPFMPPEQITSFRDSLPAVDQYAAAATLYRLLTGHYVYDFPSDVAHQLLMILTDPIVPIPARREGLPEELVQAIHRALSREPADRFPGVREFRIAIESFAD